MKKVALLLSVMAVAACHNSSDEIVVDNYYQPVSIPYDGATHQMGVDVSNDGRDLVVETDRHVIQVSGQAGTQYIYNVWTGNKDMNTDDPDVIVDRGNVMVKQAD